MSSTGELACSYAALIVHEEGLAISAENITTLVKAAKVSVESYWPVLFAKLFKGKSVDDLIFSVGSGGGGVVAAPPTAAAGAGSGGGDAPPAEDKKNEEKAEESEDEDLNMFSLFD